MSLPGNRKHYAFDEAKLKPGQRKAAMLMVEYEFEKDPKERMTQQEIADEVGVHRCTIHDWNKHDANFIEFKNYLAATAMNAYLPFVYRKLLDGINHGSMKGIELFLKRIGDMDNRTELTINDSNSDMTMEERQAEIIRRLQADINDSTEDSGKSVEQKLNKRISKD